MSDPEHSAHRTQRSRRSAWNGSRAPNVERTCLPLHHRAGTDRAAFVEVLRSHDDRMRGLAYKLLGGNRDRMDDALQDAYLRGTPRSPASAASRTSARGSTASCTTRASTSCAGAAADPEPIDPTARGSGSPEHAARPRRRRERRGCHGAGARRVCRSISGSPWSSSTVRASTTSRRPASSASAVGTVGSRPVAGAGLVVRKVLEPQTTRHTTRHHRRHHDDEHGQEAGDER